MYFLSRCRTSRWTSKRVRPFSPLLPAAVVVLLLSLGVRTVPTFAVSPGIVITKMEQSRNLHVFIVAKGTAEGFTPPETVDDYPDSEAYAGHGTIFGLFPPGGC